jgi:hypothetical protein
MFSQAPGAIIQLILRVQYGDVHILALWDSGGGQGKQFDCASGTLLLAIVA